MKAPTCLVLLHVCAIHALDAAELVVPRDHPTIQEAIDQANPGDTVVVEVGSYAENLTLKDDVDVRGRETARVLLSPERTADPIVLIADVSSVLFAKFSLVDANVGVQVQNSSDVTIASNVFDAAQDAALLTDQVSTLEVVNNVFFDNATAIRRSSDDTQVTNNIFSGNAVTITSPANIVDDDAGVSFGCFFNNDDLSQVSIDTALGTDFQVGDPLFVDPVVRDFHLREGSPCIDAGTGIDVINDTVADIGAYGGDFADSRPFPVRQPVVQDLSGAAGPFRLQVTWDRNLSYLVSNSFSPGGYELHYRLNQPGPPYDGLDAGGGTQPSPVEVGNVTSFMLEDLTPTVQVPPAPGLVSAEPRSNAVILTWTAVDGAVGYRVFYGIDSVAENQIDVASVTTHTVGSLENGTAYRFAVAVLSQARYFLAVTAFDNTQARHESELSEAQSIGIGPTVESAASNELGAIPQVTIPVPDLPDEGCFIATAAYGADWAAEVQILRDFRDRYLLPHVFGRMLARFYYALSPPVADRLDRHPYAKPWVRFALLPAVGFALVMVGSSSGAKMGILLLLTAAGGLSLRRRFFGSVPRSVT